MNQDATELAEAYERAKTFAACIAVLPDIPATRWAALIAARLYPGETPRQGAIQ